MLQKKPQNVNMNYWASFLPIGRCEKKEKKEQEHKLKKQNKKNGVQMRK